MQEQRNQTILLFFWFSFSVFLFFRFTLALLLCSLRLFLSHFLVISHLYFLPFFLLVWLIFFFFSFLLSFFFYYIPQHSCSMLALFSAIHLLVIVFFQFLPTFLPFSFNLPYSIFSIIYDFTYILIIQFFYSYECKTYFNSVSFFSPSISLSLIISLFSI